MATSVSVTADLGALRRLGRFGAAGLQVTSLYLPGGADLPAADEVATMLTAADAPQPGRLLALRALESCPPEMLAAPGLAIFAVDGAEHAEVVRLPSVPAAEALAGTGAWLEPLAASLAPGGWGVVVVDRRAARLFRGGEAALLEFAVSTRTSSDDERTGDDDRAEVRLRRAAERRVAEHVDMVTELLDRAHRSHPFVHIAIVAAPDLWPIIESALPATLVERLAGHVALDLEQAPLEAIVRAATPVLLDAERRREDHLLTAVDEAVAVGGRAAAGLDEVLSLLAEHRVASLLLAEDATLRMVECPSCGRLAAPGSERCPADGAATRPTVLGPGNVARSEPGLEVVAIRHERDRLAARGGIAALLRW